MSALRSIYSSHYFFVIPYTPRITSLHLKEISFMLWSSEITMSLKRYNKIHTSETILYIQLWIKRLINYCQNQKFLELGFHFKIIGIIIPFLEISVSKGQEIGIAEDLDISVSLRFHNFLGYKEYCTNFVLEFDYCKIRV